VVSGDVLHDVSHATHASPMCTAVLHAALGGAPGVGTAPFSTALARGGYLGGGDRPPPAGVPLTRPYGPHAVSPVRDAILATPLAQRAS
jgi:hypothetical protein